MWNGKSYDAFQNEYQFKSGCYLIEKLESIEPLTTKSVLDLGCGNGKLTSLLAEKTNRTVIAIDSDPSMLAVLREKYSSSHIESVCDDIPGWLSHQENDFDVVFSNATFHWFGSHDSMNQILRDCYRNLSVNGILAVRFSLKENAFAIKQYLAEKMAEFLGNEKFSALLQSELDYTVFSGQVADCGFEIAYGEELRYTPFDDSEQDFQFMMKSQPIHGYFSAQKLGEFEAYLEKCWQHRQVKLRSHHAVIIASKVKG